MTITRRVEPDEQTVEAFIDLLGDIDAIESVVDVRALESLLKGEVSPSEETRPNPGSVTFTVAGEELTVRWGLDFFEFTIPEHAVEDEIPPFETTTEQVDLAELNLLLAYLLFKTHLSKPKQVAAVAVLLTMLSAATPEEYSIILEPVYYIAAADWIIDSLEE